MTNDSGNPRVYDALMAIKPEGLTLNAWTVKAGVNRSAFHDMRKRGRIRHDILEKLLDAVGVSWAQFDAGQAPVRDQAGAESAVRSPFSVFRGEGRPRDVPVVGTPSCGSLPLGEDGHPIETMEMALDEVIDHVRPPATLDGRQDVYAIYPSGLSMIPKFEPSDVAYVDGRKPAAIGDYVVVQLRRADPEDGERIVSALLKRLTRRTSEYIELEQFNPPEIFRVPMRMVAKVDRVIPLAELVGI